MANVEKVRFVQNQPFLNKLTELFEEKFSFSTNDRVLNVIEIGCGPGDFALIFKDKFKERVHVTAIDPGEKDINQAKSKSTGNDVDFQLNDIFKFKSDTKFDLVMFTKSLHHCIPVDLAVKNGYDLLSDDGIFIAEEVYIDKMEEKDTAWFFDRMDLLCSAGCMKDAQEVIEKSSFSKSGMAKLLDPTLPYSKRWFRPHLHGEGEHGHNHDHGHSHDHGHKHEEHDQQQAIVESSAVVTAINGHFKKENLTFTDVPYFYQFLTFCGMKNNETSEAVLKTFYDQEERAIQAKIISPLGINIIGYK